MAGRFGGIFDPYLVVDETLVGLLDQSDAVAVMNAGRFEQVGSARDLYYRPATAFVAGFVGEANRWAGRVTAIDGGTAEVRTDSGLGMRAQGQGLAPGDRVEVFVRPEAISISHDASGVAADVNHMAVRVTALLFNGANSRVLVSDPPYLLIEIKEEGVVEAGDFRLLKAL